MERKKIIFSEVYEDVISESSTFAEAYAAIAVLRKADEMGIQKLVMWTDSQGNSETLTGEKVIKDDKYRGVFLYLRFLGKKFKKLVPIHVKRELMKFADDLANFKNVFHLSSPIFLMRRWSPYLRGVAVYWITQCPDVTACINMFGKIYFKKN
jgi:hypothetical protein